jgi:general secretion pathway protein D
MAMGRPGFGGRRVSGWCLAGVLGALSAASVFAADGPTQKVTPNFKNADLAQVAESVSAVTGKDFVFDPRVHAEVTMLSSKPLDPPAFYQAFLSILQVYGFIAVPVGDIIKILPDANARQFASVDLPDHINPNSDEIVTQVIDVKNVGASQLVPILRPMMPQYAHLAAYPSSNILILSDRANNVDRMVRIIRRIDKVGDQDVEVVSLENASSNETARMVNSLYQQAASAEGGGTPIKVVADDRSNSVVISGNPAQRLRLRALIAQLDTPLKRTGNTRVRYLRFANAEKIAPKLKEQITGIAQASAGGSGSGTGGQATPQSQAEKNALIWADAETNSLIITAPPDLMGAIMEIIDKIDIRRAQVLVESVIAEVNMDKTSDLGVNWVVGAKNGTVPIAGFIEPTGGSSLVDLAETVEGVSSGSSSTSTSSLTGTTLGIGKISAAGLSFAAVLKALSGDANTNIVATPSAVTLDNQEAELKVAQEVPIITGSYTTTSSSSSSSTNPFQTVQRQEVGTILKVTPQIASEGNSVVLKISVESSSVAATSVSSVDITTNKRTVSTNVLIEDGGIVVLGGLISDTVTRSEQRVPVLGSLPVLGNLFKTRDYSRTRNNLMVFIRPKILRTPEQAAYETNAKYNYMMDEEHKSHGKGDAPLLPNEVPPTLPPLPTAPPSSSSSAPGSP